MAARLFNLLLCALLLGLSSPAAKAITRPENRVGGSAVFSSDFAAQESANPIGTRAENPSCGYDFASGVHKYLYAADNSVNKLDPSGHDFELPTTLGAISIAVALAVIDVSAISQISVNYQKYFGLSPQDRATAIAQNNLTIAALQRIINSDGDDTFQNENLGVGGQFGMVLPGNGAFQRAANIFESYRNLEGYPSGGDELLARLGTGIWTPLPVPDSLANTPENRVILAKALLDRNQAFASWLQRNL